MSENNGVETEGQTEKVDIQKAGFLKASATSRDMLNGFNLDSFQLGGGAVDFALGEYRRPHGDIDVVYLVDSRSWGDYLADPKAVPDERVSLKNITQEPDLAVNVTSPIEMDRLGAPGMRMEGGEVPILGDFIEGYKNTEDSEEFIMLPIYEGGSFIKIPTAEIQEGEVDGVKTKTPSVEVLYLMKEQAAGYLRTLQGGPLPDRRKKAEEDMEALKAKADMDKVKKLREKKVGFNFTISSALKFKTLEVVDHLASAFSGK